jgi:hypothetical protein
VPLLLALIAATAADRGPLTPEERKQALEYIAHFEADPLNPNLRPEIQWVVKWAMEIPDVQVDLCPILDQLPKGDTKDGQTLFTAMVLAQTAFVIENPERQSARWRSIRPMSKAHCGSMKRCSRPTPKTASLIPTI